MRLAIVTSRRYHLFDLARELEAMGHVVQLFSGVSQTKGSRKGVSEKAHRSLRQSVLPWLALQRIAGPRFHDSIETRIQRAVDKAAARRLGRCDAVIGLSGTCVRSFQKARGRFRARLYLERGGRHILSHKDMLEQIPGGPRPAVPHAEIKREIWGYNHADVVVVASRHAEQSFLERGVDASRVFRNPYGVDLEKFGPTARLPREIPTVLYVGSWTNKNGCDLLGHALRGQHIKLVHVGPTGDAPRPAAAQFEHRDVVEDWELCQIFRSVDILVRPTRGEGMDMVLAQALAAGVPIVCTDRSGGDDFREFVSDPAGIVVAKAGNLETLTDAIRQGLAYAFTQGGARSLLTSEGRATLTWRAYGERYGLELVRRLGIKPVDASATEPLGLSIAEAEG
ncbi:hypothetical protein ASA1KI_36740 [Opitutales bacterium ASA1]|uniref:glycosyltransferase family 4 protein n=1 Tax=Congregicoccus parvus TaxID=3081749 RepID=UPI002B2ECCA7|nr:hypothetical protein ASA1KI_36740 [Opitutales bacterium ASA1]